ncbi:LysM peptidoglycan-binding domain-containing protein [Ornithinimicrobium sp. W1679]|uniref:LysM peptidoglycan-binding domain-containing protein n=1 Tax=Ornithinimicrobium sp. W1679 TaxID=3418770 RepID=UPI003CFAA85D
MRARERLAGLGALVVLAAILIGLPALLLALGGHPLPTALPTIERVQDVLLTPDDGTLALAAAKALGWVVWAALSAGILLEGAAALRGVRAPALPVLSLPQAGMRPLVVAALALFITAPSGIGTPPAATATPAAATAPAGAGATTAPATPISTRATITPPASPPPASTPAGTRVEEAGRDISSSYVVRPGDTLWSIAQRHLGSGQDYHRIVDLNPQLLAAGPDRITPGTRLRLPLEESATVGEQARRVVVQRGDTLSALAAEHLGEASRWPQIYDASTGIVQPDGAHLRDPDLIHPGWQLNLPATTEAPQRPADHDQPASTTDHKSSTGNDVQSARGRTGTTAPTPAHVSTGPDRQASGAAVTAARSSASAGTSLGLSAPAGHGGSTPDTGGNVPQDHGGDLGGDGPGDTSGDAAGDTSGDAAGETSGDVAGDAQGVHPSWVLDGLVGSGAFLGGGLFMALTRARRSRSRDRRPGRALPPAPAVLAPVEKTLQTRGVSAVPTLDRLDEVLRRLGAARADHAVPALVALELSAAGLRLHLASPVDLTAPWQPTALDTDQDTGEGTVEGTGPGTEQGLGWFLPAGAPVEEVGPLPLDAPAPYPLLVTVGTDEAGSTWLLNLEEQVVVLSGAGEYAADLARYLAAEIAVNPWSVGVRLDCVGMAEAVAGMNPARLRVAGPDAVDDLLPEALRVAGRVGDDGDVPTARVRQEGEDTWPARAVLIDADTALGRPAGEELLRLLTTHPGRTGASLLLTGTTQVGTGDAGGLSVEATATGRVLVPSLGLDLVGVGLTGDEAAGCAALLAHARDEPDTPMPPAAPEHAAPGTTGEQGWRPWADQAGALLPEHTLDRHRPDGPGAPDTPEVAVPAAGVTQVDDAILVGDATDDTTGGVLVTQPSEEATQIQDGGEPQDVGDGTGQEMAATLLEGDDETYQDEAATTAADLAVLSPGVPHTVGKKVQEADPGLDQDLAAWWDQTARVPRLRLLGPVRARTWGRPLAERKAYVTELLAYLSLHPGGVTAAQIAEAFGITPAKTRDYINRCRDWLGTDPATGALHLPHAQDSPAARERGGNIYQVLGLLVDVDLFRRLRARAQARGGTEGIQDLKEALRLVEGVPFDQLRRGGWAWLYEGDRIDHHMACAVVDVAHLVITHDLATGDLAGARAAAQIAHRAAPSEEITTLDLAAITAREGHTHQAMRLLQEDVCNRTDDPDLPPQDLPERTKQIIDRHGWLKGRREAV